MAVLRVERTRFLELAFAISAAHVTACGNGPEPQVVTAPLDIKPIADPRPAASPTKSEAMPIASAPPPAVAAARSAGIWGLPFDASAPPRGCAQIKCTGPVREGMTALRSSCKQLEGELRAEPFQRFLACLAAAPSTDTCDLKLVGTEPGDCLEGWSSPPTIDPATAATCKPIVAACAGPNRSPHASKALTMETCQGILSVTAPRAEKKMIHCVTEYCEGARDLCYMATMY